MTTTLEPRKSMEPYLRDDVVFYPHQIEGIRKLMRWKSGLLADDMGLGKSVQALTVFIGDVFTGQGNTAIVVCPVTLRANWADEIEKFTRIPYILLGEEYNPTTGRPRILTPIERSRQVVEFAMWNKPKIMIVNYEQVDAHLDELNALNARMLIFDEAHKIKGAETKRTKACLALKGERSFLLTGTPILNDVSELWPILNRIAPDHFPNPYSFKNRYCIMGGYKNKTITGHKNQKQLHAILEQVMLRRLKSEVLDLPEVQYIQMQVELSPTQQALYEQAEEELQIENVDPNCDPYELDDAMQRMMRLLQICGTPATLGYPDDSYKLDAVTEKALELVRRGEKVAVFTRFRPVLHALERRFTQAMIPTMVLHGDTPRHERQPLVKSVGQIPGGAALIAMSQVAGEGLNMTWSKYCFRVDRLFVPGLNRQIVDRLHRIGADETQPIQVFDFIARGTMEARVEAINRMKEREFKSIIEDASIVREILRAIRNKEA